MRCSQFSLFYRFLITQGILITELQSNLFKTGFYSDLMGRKKHVELGNIYFSSPSPYIAKYI